MDRSIPVTAVEFINFSADLLKKKNISEPRLTSELLLCDILNCTRVNLYLNFDKPLNKSETDILKEYLIRRINNEPLQYILGKASFYGFDFKVNKHVLIPRPETELLVEHVLTDIKKNDCKEVSVFEIGAGSGCISIALAKLLEAENINYNIFSIDISEPAVGVAKENLVLNGLYDKKIRFLKKDIFEIEKLNKNVDYIISNPPYVGLLEYNLLEPEIRNNEPDIAVTDYGNGLKYYERIFSISAEENFSGKVFCEIGFGQEEKIKSLLREKGFKNYYFYNDYNNIPRIVKAEK